MKGKSPLSDPVGLRIVQEACREFLSLGFSRVTMDDLAEKLGMSKKTLYQYFPGKNQLLEAVLEHKRQSVEQDLKMALAQSAPGVQARLLVAVSCLQRHLQEIQRPFIRDLQRLAPEFFVRVQKRRQELIQRYLGAIITEGIRSGELRSDLPANLVLEILMGTIDGIMHPNKIMELGISPEEAFSAIFTLFLKGMQTRKGKNK